MRQPAVGDGFTVGFERVWIWTDAGATWRAVLKRSLLSVDMVEQAAQGDQPNASQRSAFPQHVTTDGRAEFVGGAR